MRNSLIGTLAVASLSAITYWVGSASSIKAQPSPTFFCGARDGAPVTYVNNLRGDIPIIRWESVYFAGSGWTPQRRCEEVSRRFQRLHDDGTLKYITTGRMNRQTVVCVSQRENGRCDTDGLLLTLHPNDNAPRIVSDLFDIQRGRAGSEHIMHSGNRVYIDFEEWLRERPAEASDSSNWNW